MKTKILKYNNLTTVFTWSENDNNVYVKYFKGIKEITSTVQLTGLDDINFDNMVDEFFEENKDLNKYSY